MPALYSRRPGPPATPSPSSAPNSSAPSPGWPGYGASCCRARAASPPGRARGRAGHDPGEGHKGAGAGRFARAWHLAGLVEPLAEDEFGRRGPLVVSSAGRPGVHLVPLVVDPDGTALSETDGFVVFRARRYVDGGSPASEDVRAEAITEALHKGEDYARALGSQLLTPILAPVRVVRYSSFGALANQRPAWLACRTEEDPHGRF
jgi:hypothetical protein